MAKDTEKLIRQLSLISYLMAERRPVTALEIRRDVEGYSGMNEDAFARRFYADRAELESLGISLAVDKPTEGAAEQENYSLPPENLYLRAIEFSDRELAALHLALSKLDGSFAYAEPLRLALQQISWGRPSPLRAPDQQTVELGITASAGGQELSQRLSKLETAIFRRKTVVFEYYTMERDEVGERRVDPYHLLFQGGQFYLLGYSHERDAVRVFRLSRIRAKVAYATKAEHDFHRPADFDPRSYAGRAAWQYGDPLGTAEILIDERVAWQVERHFGGFGELREQAGDRVFQTDYANPRLLISWVLGLGEHAQLLGPPELVAEFEQRVALLADRHGEGPEPAPEVAVDPVAEEDLPPRGDAERRESAIRPERFARLVTLATILIEAGRGGRRLTIVELCESLQLSEQELQEDISVLNVVNFGGGTYVLYAEIHSDGTVEVDPEPYGDSFARPARLLPVEAKALVAAIDLVGEHVPGVSLATVRAKVVDALGRDPVEEGLQIAAGADDPEIAAIVSRAIARSRLLRFEYWKQDVGELSKREVEPYALMNGREGWYVVAFDPTRGDVRHFRLDRVKSAEVSDERFEPRPEVDPAADIDGWPRTGEVEASRTARVWVSPERARWVREERPVVGQRADGSIVVEFPFKGERWLVKEILKEAGDLAVLEPTDVRDAVREAASRLAAGVGAR